MRNVILLAMATSLAASAGCAMEPPADFPSQEELYGPEEYKGFAVSTQRGMIYSAKVDRGGILGLDVNLGRYRDPDDRAIRGHAFEQLVQLEMRPNRAHGVVNGTLPFDITSRREGGALRVSGLVRGYPADFRLDDVALTGALGRCSCDLVAASGDHRYTGTLDCVGGTTEVSVRLPDELLRWDDAELGAALGLLLGG